MGLLAQAFGENYTYYDTPEGDDCLDKLFYVTKYAAVYGVLLSSVDVTLISHPVGYGATAARYAYVTLPLTGIAAGWVGAVCAATNIRKKDDHWNYAIGGATAGALIGAWKKSLRVGCYSAFLVVNLLSCFDWPDDHWNYAIGGATAGALIGAWKKSLRVGCYSALVGAAISALKKDSIMNNWGFINGDHKPMYNNLWSVHRDYTITDDPPKTWTT